MALQEPSDQIRAQVGLLIQSEVAGVEDTHLGARVQVLRAPLQYLARPRWDYSGGRVSARGQRVGRLRDDSDREAR